MCHLTTTEIKSFVRISTSGDWGVYTNVIIFDNVSHSQVSRAQFVLLTPLVSDLREFLCLHITNTKKPLWIRHEGGGDYSRKVATKHAAIYLCAPFSVGLALWEIQSKRAELWKQVQMKSKLIATSRISLVWNLTQMASERTVSGTSGWMNHCVMLDDRLNTLNSDANS